jgi:hypothetical protein
MNLLALLGLLALLPAAALAQPPGRLLVPGRYLDEPAAKPGDEWLCIVIEHWAVSTRKCKLKAEAAKPADDHAYGTSIAVETRGETIFLVKDVAGVREGPVPTVFSGRSSLSEPGARIELGTFEKASVSVWKGSSGGDEVVLAVGDTSQVIARSGALDDVDVGLPALRWAGDLDGDGKLDLLIDVSAHPAETQLELFLSSHAAPGELVGRAATLSKTNC